MKEDLSSVDKENNKTIAMLFNQPSIDNIEWTQQLRECKIDRLR